MLRDLVQLRGCELIRIDRVPRKLPRALVVRRLEAGYFLGWLDHRGRGESVPACVGFLNGQAIDEKET